MRPHVAAISLLCAGAGCHGCHDNHPYVPYSIDGEHDRGDGGLDAAPAGSG